MDIQKLLQNIVHLLVKGQDIIQNFILLHQNFLNKYQLN